jgi:hypothetical protein
MIELPRASYRLSVMGQGGGGLVSLRQIKRRRPNGVGLPASTVDRAHLPMNHRSGRQGAHPTLRQGLMAGSVRTGTGAQRSQKGSRDPWLELNRLGASLGGAGGSRPIGILSSPAFSTGSTD